VKYVVEDVYTRTFSQQGVAVRALERVKPVQKSSAGVASERPLPKDHFDPTRVQANPTAPEQNDVAVIALPVEAGASRTA